MTAVREELTTRWEALRQRVRGALHTARRSAPRWGPAMWSEMRKDLLVELSYRLDLILSFVLWILIFLGSVLLVGGGQITPALLASAALGFVLTSYAGDIMQYMTSHVEAAARAGTLEQLYLSIVPARVLMLAKMMGSLIISTVSLLLSGVVLMAFTEFRLAFKWEAIPVVILTWLGLFGFGYIVAGGTLLFKQIGSASSLLTGMLYFVNGTYIPLETLSPTLSILGRLLPAGQGIIVLRAIVLEGRTLGDVLGDGSAVFLIVHSTILFALGWQIFRWAETIAKQRGSLGQY